MKKTILLITICIAGIMSANAQIAKGNLFVGTGLGTTTYNFGNYTYTYASGEIRTQDEKEYSLSVTPQIGVFLTDHVVFGGNLNISYTHNEGDNSYADDAVLTNNSVTNTTVFSVGPFIRYYFFDSKPSKTLFFIQAEAAVGTGAGNTSTSTANTNSSGSTATGTNSGTFIFDGGASLGVTHFISKSIGIDFRVGYTYDYESYTTTLNSTSTTASGAVTTTPNSYKASIPENGITLAAAFHFFLDAKKDKR